MTRNGIVFKSDCHTINLDPKRADSNSINFVSHAHADHLPSYNEGTILTSYETSKIASLRGVRLENHVETLDGFSLTDSGHVLGSRGLLFDDVFYTGDICTRDRGFLPGASIPKCKTIITECTFGLPEFKFPAIHDIESRVNEIISDLYSRGIPVILMGYQLGKAQTLSSLFGHWQPLIYHDSVKSMNDLHRSLGVELEDAPSHSEAESSGMLERKPWVMIAPMLNSTNEFVGRMKSKYGAVTIGFSGWAGSTRVSFGRKCDHSIPLSDHCDFDELVHMIQQSGAEKIYTTHGFVDEFAAHLNKLGFDAQPLH